MNKYLMMSAAALLGSTSSAMAGQVTLTVGNSCDVFEIYWQGDLYVGSDDYTPCGIDSVSRAISLKGKLKGFGRAVAFSDYYKGDVNAGYWVSFVFQLPFKTGNKVNGYYTTNGVSVINYLQTTYEVEQPGKTAPRSNVSTVDLLRQSLAKARQ